MDYNFLSNTQRNEDFRQINIQIDNMNKNINELAQFIEQPSNSSPDHPVVTQNKQFCLQKIKPLIGEYLKQLKTFKEIELQNYKAMDNISFYTTIENKMQGFYKTYQFTHTQVKYYLERKSILNSEDQEADLRLLQDIIN